MSSSLAEHYFRWLSPQIRDKHSDPDKTFGDLLRLMFDKKFVELVPHDSNRMADGTDLRADFCYGRGLPTDSLAELGDASFLEVLLGLSRRLSFTAGGKAHGWAWQLLCNLELHRFPDPLTRNKARQADQIMETCIRRTYTPDGQGGFFPLAWPDEDQTQVELWYQMAAYIGELHPEN